MMLMVLDKIYDTWDNVEETYRNTVMKHPGMSKYDFLVMLLGKDDSLVKLRSLIDRDFTATGESIKKLNTLFVVLEDARKRLQGVSSVDDLESFVWGTPAQEVFVLDAEDYNPSRLTCYEDEEEMWKNGYFTSAFVLEGDGSVSSYLLDISSQKMKFFSTEAAAVSWANNFKARINKGDSFLEKLYLYLLSAAADKKLEFPCVFTAFNPGTEPAGKVSYKAKLPDADGNKIVCSVNAVMSHRELLPGSVEVVYLE